MDRRRATERSRSLGVNSTAAFGSSRLVATAYRLAAESKRGLAQADPGSNPSRHLTSASAEAMAATCAPRYHRPQRRQPGCTGRRVLTEPPSILRMRVDWRSRTAVTSAIRSCARTQTPPKPKGTGRLAYHAQGLMVFETALRFRCLTRLKARERRGENQYAQPSQWRYAVVPDHR